MKIIVVEECLYTWIIFIFSLECTETVNPEQFCVYIRG